VSAQEERALALMSQVHDLRVAAHRVDAHERVALLRKADRHQDELDNLVAEMAAQEEA